MARRQRSVDVAIVGAGPVGLVLAALLDRAGVTSCVFERRAGLHPDPQAHVLNTRTMEILRELKVERAVQAIAAPPLLLRSITWCESIAGRELGRIDLQGSADAHARLALSPTTIANLAQNRLEPLLLDAARRSLEGEVRFGHEVTSVCDRGDHVAVRVRDDGGIERETAASWVVACDGAGSRIRSGLGIDMIGPASLGKFVSIYFEANLDRFIGARTGPLFWIGGARTRGVVIGFDLVRTWALMVPYEEPHTPADFTPAVAERMVRDAIGSEDADFRIASIGNWNMSAQLAERFRDGRVFLAGDAAHRFPPSGGLGMNTGIQDAHNLAWKLAAVIRGEADASLLDSYETERRPVALTNSDQSVRNALRMFEVDMVLGTSVFAPVDPSVFTATPSPLRDYGLDGDDEAPVAKRAELAAVIQSQAEHFDFGGLDLGFRYDDGAIVPDGTDAPPLDVRVYTPAARPGSRLPHVWLEHLGRRVSTLDAVQPGRFTLVTGRGGSSWIAAAREIGLELALAVIVDRDPEPGEYLDAQAAWARVSALDPGGALLVRPDGHVGWRSASGADCLETAREALQHAFARMLPSPGGAVSSRKEVA